MENTKKLTTEAYKGVRDFYPEDLAIRNYLFSSWRKTALSFGFEEYDASVLEPADLYRSKGADNAEIIDEQSYTFTDRGEREVTLRPEMTPTVARMVAHKKRELKFPLRWFSIPNLFRYERPQRGRLREHWQLNCDIFGSEEFVSDIEIISLAHQIFLDLGATEDMFTIIINDRKEMEEIFANLGISSPDQIAEITKLNDRKKKISVEDYKTQLLKIVKSEDLVKRITEIVENKNDNNYLLETLKGLGINNAVLDRSLARGFSYYTGVIFEIIDTSPENKRSFLGGGRFDNLTKLFSDEPIVGVGFGMGDVAMVDFLKTHKLLPEKFSEHSPLVSIIPLEESLNLATHDLAQKFRKRGIKTMVDFGKRKLAKKIQSIVEKKIPYVIIFGEDELKTQKLKLKNLSSGVEKEGSLEEILVTLIAENS